MKGCVLCTQALFSHAGSQLWIGREFCEELNEVYPKSICQSLHELQLLVYKRVFTLLNQPLYCLEREFCIGTICSVRIFQWMNNMKE